MFVLVNKNDGYPNLTFSNREQRHFDRHPAQYEVTTWKDKEKVATVYLMGEFKTHL